MSIFSAKEREKLVFKKIVELLNVSHAGNINAILEQALKDTTGDILSFTWNERKDFLSKVVALFLFHEFVEWDVVETEILRAVQFFRVTPKDLEDVNLPRAMKYAEMKNKSAAGKPVIYSPPEGIRLKEKELIFFAESAELLEEKVVDSRYEGGSHGISVRLAKGVSYRVGSSRGRIVSEKGIVPVDEGTFYITNMRCIFHGNRLLTIPIRKIFQTEEWRDAISISEDGKQKPRLIFFGKGLKKEAAWAILQNVIKQEYGEFEAKSIPDFEKHDFESQYPPLIDEAKKSVTGKLRQTLLFIGILCFVVFVLVLIFTATSSNSEGNPVSPKLEPVRAEQNPAFLETVSMIGDVRSKSCFLQAISLLTPSKSAQKEWETIEENHQEGLYFISAARKNDIAQISWTAGIGKDAVQTCFVEKFNGDNIVFSREGYSLASDNNPDFFSKKSPVPVMTDSQPNAKKERIEKECNCGVTVMSYSYICSVTKQTKENCLAKFNNEPAAKMCEGVMSDADKIKLIERVYTDKQFQELAKKGTGELAATCISNRMND